MVSFAYPVYNQIRLLVSSITKKSFRATVSELKDLVRMYGDDSRLFLLRCLIEDIDFHDKSHKDPFKLQLLLQELADLSLRPNFTGIICRALEPNNVTADYLNHFIKSLKLPISLQTQLALGLSQSSHDATRNEGVNLLKAKVAEALEPNNPDRLSELVVLELSFFIRASDLFPARVRLQLIHALQSQYPQTQQILSSPVLAPFQARKSPSIDGASSNVIHQLRLHANHPADLLQDLGYSAMQTSEKLEQVLSEFPPVSEVDAARIIGMMLRTHTGLTDDPSLNLLNVLTGQGPRQDEHKDAPGSTWNASVFVATLHRLVPRLNWPQVFRSLDLPDFAVPDRKALDLLIEIHALTSRNAPFPFEFVFSDWRHKTAQASLLYAFVAFAVPATDALDLRRSPHVQHPLEGINYVLAAPAFAAQPIETADNKSPVAASLAPVDEATYHRHCHAWLSLDVVDTLLALSEVSPDLYYLAKRAFASGLDRSPELLLCALIQITGRSSNLREELLALLIPMFLQQHPNSSPVLQRLWQSPSGMAFVLRGMVDLYSQDRGFVQRVLDISNELRDSLTVILEARPFGFAIDVAAQAARRGSLDLAKWLQLRLAEHNGPFALSCIEYLRDNLSRFDNKSDPAVPSPTAGATPSENRGPELQNAVFSRQAISNFFKVLLNSASALPADTSAEVERLHSLYCQAMPDLAHESTEPPADDVIAHKANTIFQKIYSEQISLLDVINMLRHFKNSENQVDREVYACMIHNLFDEYRFFPKYPLKELHITGLLFGLLIQHQVVSSYTLGIALRYVLEALRKPEDSKVFKFGMWALVQFKSRLHQWPQYCKLINQIPHLRTANPDIAESLDRILAQQQDGAPSMDTNLQLPGSSESIILNSVNAEQTPRHDLSSSPTDPTLDSDLSLDASRVGPNASPSLLGMGQGFPGPSPSPPPGRSLPPGMGIAPGVHNMGSLSGLAGGAGGGSGSAAGGANPVFPNPSPSPSPGPAPAGPAPSSPTGPTASGSSSAQNTPVRPREQGNNSALPGTPLKPRNLGAGFGPGQLNLESLLPAQQGSSAALPNEALEDKIHFIVNNVTKANLKAKAKELKMVLKPEHYPFFARYLVVKRVAAETNQHKLYASFLETFASEPLNKNILETTYDKIKILLTNDKCLHSATERSVLKNLGSWLGLMTIAKRKPVLAKRIDLKELILDGYDHGRLIAVIPFIGKVLEPAGKNKIFKPPNPWVMAVVSVLREIYDLPGLKLNLKFEIEMLATHLGVKMKDVKPSNLLRNRQVRTPGINMNVLSRSNSTGNVNTYAAAPIPAGLPPPGPNQHISSFEQPALYRGSTGPSGFPDPNVTMPPGPDRRMGQSPPPPPSQPGAGTTSPFGDTVAPSGPMQMPTEGGGGAGSEPTTIPNLANFVTINPSINLFQISPMLKRFVPTALDRGLHATIPPVSERSVTIACVTTRELVVKDFNFEPDEAKLRKAAHQMVQTLTSSLVLATCSEPLKHNIHEQFVPLLQAQLRPSGADPSTTQMVEAAFQQIFSDNLELCMAYVEKASMDRAVREIDDALQSEYAIRRTHREKQTQTPYTALPFNAANIQQSSGLPGLSQAALLQNSRFMSSLPDPLRPRPTGLAGSQLRVYEEFTRIPTIAMGAMSGSQSSQASSSSSASPATGSSTPVRPGSPSGTRTPSLVSSGGGTANATSPSPLPSVGGGSATASPALSGVSAVTIAAPTALPPGVRSGQGGAGGPASMSPGLSPRSAAAAAAGGGPMNVPPAPGGPLPAIGTIADVLPGINNPGYTQNQRALMEQLASVLNNIEQLLRRTHQSLAARPGAPPKEPPEVVTRELQTLYGMVQRAVIEQLREKEGDREREREVDVVLASFAKMVFKRLFASPRPYYMEESLLALLRYLSMLDHRWEQPAVGPELTQLLLYLLSNAPQIPEPAIIFNLIRSRLVNISDVEGFLAANLTNNNTVVEFSLGLVRLLVATDQPVLQVKEVSRLLDALVKLGRTTQFQTLADAIAKIMQDVRTVAATQGMAFPEGDGGKAKPDGFDGPAGLQGVETDIEQLHLDDGGDTQQVRAQIHYLLDDWIQLCLAGTASDKTYAQYLAMLQQQQVLATEESTRRFFRVVIELCLDYAFQGANQNGELSYAAIDALGKLAVFLVKFMEHPIPVQGPNASQQLLATKIHVLSTFLSVAVSMVHRDYAAKKEAFNQRPYLRLFTNIFYDFHTADPTLDSNNFMVLSAFATALHALRPSRVPGFCFAWLELISHRMFMPKLLIPKIPQYSLVFLTLLVDLFQFLEPYLRSADLSEPIRLLYKGTLRVLLVLLHDFPDFLCDFHFSLCDVIPASCIQMRNLVLSAFPHNMRLPDPFTPNLKVDLLPEIHQPPRILSDVTTILEVMQLKVPLDSLLSMLSTCGPRRPSEVPNVANAMMPFLSELAGKVSLSTTDAARAGTKLNAPLLNSLVMYIGNYGVKSITAAGVVSPDGDVFMELFQQLLLTLDAEGRYCVLNAIANQLRYPNSQTYYFSCVLLYLFSQAKEDSAAIKEQVTRVLLERLIVHRPHPWGLLITFVELIKNQKYNFWEQPFTRCAPEIERLFESVARSCMPGSGAKHGQAGLLDQTSM